MALLWATSAAAQELDEIAWREPFDDPKPWTPRPSWVANASTTASVRAEDGTICFRVDEPRRGMKWSAPSLVIPIDEFPYLSIRYRAENIETGRTDYLVYLNDGNPSLQGGVFANAFHAKGKTVYTFYNACHRTVRGPVCFVILIRACRAETFGGEKM